MPLMIAVAAPSSPSPLLIGEIDVAIHQIDISEKQLDKMFSNLFANNINRFEYFFWLALGNCMTCVGYDN